MGVRLGRGGTLGDVMSEHCIGQSEVCRGSERKVAYNQTIRLATSLIHYNHITKISFSACFDQLVDAVVSAIDRLGIWYAQFNFPGDVTYKSE